MDVFRSRAPLRISFAGGGSDLPPYCIEHGGHVISTTINKYIYTSLYLNASKTIIIHAFDLGEIYSFDLLKDEPYPYNGKFDLVKAVLNKFNLKTGAEIYIHSDLPAGSGMGTSSSMTVALISLLSKYKCIDLTKYEIAQLACDIERDELKQTGGYQDQFASTFGGINFIEFSKETLVSPLHLEKQFLYEFNYRLVLCYTGKTHVSSDVQDEVLKNYETVDFNHGMKLLKKRALEMRDVLLRQNFSELKKFGKLQHLAWVAKKKLSNKISNESIEKLYQYSLKNGAIGGKLLGAGGGGFLLLFVDPKEKINLIKKMESMGGSIVDFHFENTGVVSWGGK